MNNNPKKIYIVYFDQFDITSDYSEEIRNIVKKYNKELIYIDFNKYTDFYNNSTDIFYLISDHIVNEYIGISSLVRFFIPLIIDEEDILYIDNDMLFTNNIDEFFVTENDKDNLFIGCCDYFLNKPSTKYLVELNHKYINAGLLWININKYKKYKIIDKIYNIYETQCENIKYMNQDVYNLLMNEYKSKIIQDDKTNISVQHHNLDKLTNIFEYNCIHLNGRKYNDILDLYNFYIDKYNEVNSSNLKCIWI
jgi:lipopolysaccharide biosynthesis glycosyltransferase